MAKTIRAKHTKPVSKSQLHSRKKPVSTAKPPKELKNSKKTPAGEVAVSGKTLKPAQRLAAAMQDRKKAGEKGKTMFGRPQGRRGRRPKNLADYTPEHQEDENYALESQYEGLEYDTGIQVKQPRDEGFNAERFEEFDEELNFDG
jgi:hypothetical protein